MQRTLAIKDAFPHRAAWRARLRAILRIGERAGFHLTPVSIVAAVSIVVAVWIGVDTLHAVVRYHTALPIWDEWDDLDIYRSWTLHHYPLRDLFIRNNEHVIFFPRLAFFADYGWLHGRQILNSVLIMLTQGGQLAVLLFCLRKAGPASAYKTALAAAVTILLFNLRQFENFVWKFELQFLLVYTAANLSILSFGLAVCAERGGKTPLPGLVLAALAALVATFSMANGVLCGFVLVLLAVVMRAPRWMLVFAVAVALILSALFFLASVLNDNPDVHASGVHDVLRFLRFFTAFLGNPIKFDLRAAQALGLWGLVATGAAAWLVLRPRGGGIDPVVFAIMVFIVATAGVTAFGRMHMDEGSAYALSSRYTTPSEIFWSAQLIFWWSVVARRRIAPTLPVVVALGLTAVVLMAVALQAQVSAKPELRNRDIALRRSADALLTGVMDPILFDWVIWGVPEALRQGHYLRDNRLSIFADKAANLLHHPLAWAGAAVDPKACLGAIEVVEPKPDTGDDAQRVAGRAWNLRSNAPVDRIFIADDAGLVVGYASGSTVKDDKAGWTGYAIAPAHAELQAWAWLGGRKLCALGSTIAPPTSAD